MAESPLPFFPRFVLAWACFFRVMFDGVFARDVSSIRERGRLPAVRPPMQSIPAIFPPPQVDTALLLLALLQREGRLVDFLEQDVRAFSDADVGVAARVVHEGCKKALDAHLKLGPIREEEEGSRVTVPPGVPPAELKLSGNVTGAPPFTGVLRHRGWRAIDLKLPVPMAGHDPNVLAPAEVEL